MFPCQYDLNLSAPERSEIREESAWLNVDKIFEISFTNNEMERKKGFLDPSGGVLREITNE